MMSENVQRHEGTTMDRQFFNKSLYSKGALLKAAYHFTDRAYIYLDQDETRYQVDITAKDDEGDEEQLVREFSNELLAQSTREEILRATSGVRELVLGRAFGSTIVDDAGTGTETTSGESGTEGIFADWFRGSGDG